VLDERVPEILRTVRRPTFITVDQDFWDRRWCHPDYCILYFALSDEQQFQLPDLLRALLRLPEFRSRAGRMGKVARVRPTAVEWWQFPPGDLHQLTWPASRG
jgi:hypothetical protein